MLVSHQQAKAEMFNEGTANVDVQRPKILTGKDGSVCTNHLQVPHLDTYTAFTVQAFKTLRSSRGRNEALKVSPLLFAETPLEHSFPGLSEYTVPRKFLTPPLLTRFHFTEKKKGKWGSFGRSCERTWFKNMKTSALFMNNRMQMMHERGIMSLTNNWIFL